MYLYARKGISSRDWKVNPDGTGVSFPNADYKILTSLMGANDWAYDPNELAFAQVFKLVIGVKLMLSILGLLRT